MASVGSFAALKWGPRVRQQAKPVGSPVGIALLVRIEARWNGQRKWPEPRFRPSLNREASRLGDVRVRRPSSRAQVPETCRDQSIACRNNGLFSASPPAGISSGSSAKTATLWRRLHQFLRVPHLDWGNQVSRVSATLRNRKSRKTLIRFDVRSSSG